MECLDSKELMNTVRRERQFESIGLNIKLRSPRKVSERSVNHNETQIRLVRLISIVTIGVFSLRRIFGHVFLECKIIWKHASFAFGAIISEYKCISV